MDDLSDIRAFYNDGWEREADRLAHRQLEADVTWRYLDRYLPDQGRILEVGFGTGAYTFPLARRGFQITAVDLSSAEPSIVAASRHILYVGRRNPA